MSNPTNTGAPSYVTNPSRQTWVFPATINVADPAALADLNTSTLSLDANGRLRTVLSGPAPAGIVGVQPAVLVNSVGVTGRVVGPAAANVDIATITPAAGTYDIEVFAHYDAGAPAAAEINNMYFDRQGTVVSILSVLAVLNAYSPARKFRQVLNGAQAIRVRTVAAGTAAVGYNAEITAIQIA